jgi:hypothetical protein
MTTLQTADEVRRRLMSLVGKRGFLPIQEAGEMPFTVLSIQPPKEPQVDIERMINFSRFSIRFDEGVLIDGANTMVIGGSSFSSLNDGKY